MTPKPDPQTDVNDRNVEDMDGTEPRRRVNDRDAWRELLLTRVDAKGNIVVVPNVSNAITMLRYHPKWRGVLEWDAFGERIVTRRPAPWHPTVAPFELAAGGLRETDTARITDWFARNEHLTIGAKVVEQGVAVVAEASAFHPVRDYLQSLHWDGVKRLPTWLSTYCGVEASPYAAAVGARWLISAVARPMDPGCQLDCCLIVEDPRQGTGKSSAFRALVPDPSMYSETGVTLGDKDSYQALHGAWIYLLDELDSLRRSDVTRTKNFLTSVKDHYRPSYGRVARDFARQNVFAGTTNAERYFADRTGNRRFWPVRTRGEIDVAAIRGVRDQLWAEAFDRYANGERWHVDTPELRRLCEEQQADRVADDPWEQLVGEWLAEPD
jgi:putative DNA primase/helicase